MESNNTAAFIHIVGMNTLQNTLLLLFLKEKMHLIGRSVHKLDKLDKLDKLESAMAIHENGSIPTQLLLLDYPSTDKNDFWPRFSTWKRSVTNQYLVALYNIERGKEVEIIALRNKIQGLFYKNDNLDIIAKGISAILKGDIWYSRPSLKKYITDSNHSIDMKENVDLSKLTFREREILTLIAAGASNKTIADRLYISPHTVKNHIYNIYKKLNISNRLQAALWAARYL